MKNFLKRGVVAATVMFGSFTSLFAAQAATCKVNGQEVPCGDVSGALIGGGLIFVFVMLALGVVSLIIWIKMLIHAIQHGGDNKVAWILVIVFAGVLGAIIYYFVVKKPMDNQMK